MKLFVVSLEGVLARMPLSEPFPETPPILEGIEFYGVLRGNANVVIATGLTDRLGVKHWLRTHGLNGEPVEHPADNWNAVTSELWESRLTVVDRLNRESRGQIVLFDASRVIAKAENPFTLMQPIWGKHRSPVGNDEVMGLNRPWMPGNLEVEEDD